MDHFYIYDVKFPMSEIAPPQFIVGQFQTFSKKKLMSFISIFYVMKILPFKGGEPGVAISKNFFGDNT